MFDDAIAAIEEYRTKVASVLAMEVFFRKEQGAWKLYRQHMEKYADV
ncbi:hypothetical protein [Paenibacillus dokdonensis]|nr:hypothetical protein [Paenibacillus dokdonensis]